MGDHILPRSQCHVSHTSLRDLAECAALVHEFPEQPWSALIKTELETCHTTCNYRSVLRLITLVSFSSSWVYSLTPTLDFHVTAIKYEWKLYNCSWHAFFQVPRATKRMPFHWFEVLNDLQKTSFCTPLVVWLLLLPQILLGTLSGKTHPLARTFTGRGRAAKFARWAFFFFVWVRENMMQVVEWSQCCVGMNKRRCLQMIATCYVSRIKLNRLEFIGGEIRFLARLD